MNNYSPFDNNESDNFFKSKELSETGLIKSSAHKYYKREGSRGNYKYYYTEKEYREAKGIKEKNGIMNKIISFFKEKLSLDFKKEYNEMGKQYKVSESVFADHLMEYFKNKSKWDAKFSKEKKQVDKKKTIKEKSPLSKEFIPEEKQRKISDKKINNNLMKAIAEKYGNIKPSETEKKTESNIVKTDIQKMAERISSIGELNGVNNTKILTPIFQGNVHPTKVIISQQEWQEVKGNKNLMKKLASKKILEGKKYDDYYATEDPTEKKQKEIKEEDKDYYKRTPKNFTSFSDLEKDSEMKEQMKQIKKFVSKDKTSGSLTKIKYDAENKKLIAIDGRKMSVVDVSHLNNLPKEDKYLESGTLKEVDEPKQKFPNYQMFIPKKMKYETKINTKELKNAIKKIKPLIDKETNKITFVTKYGKSYLVAGDNKNINGLIPLNMFIPEDSNNISFNYKLLNDMFDNKKEETIFKMIDNVHQVLIDGDEKNYKIIMPMRQETDYSRYDLEKEINEIDKKLTDIEKIKSIKEKQQEIEFEKQKNFEKNLPKSNNSNPLIKKYTNELIKKYAKSWGGASDKDIKRTEEMFNNHINLFKDKNAEEIIKRLPSDNIISRNFFSDLMGIKLSAKESVRKEQIRDYFNK